MSKSKIPFWCPFVNNYCIGLSCACAVTFEDCDGSRAYRCGVVSLLADTNEEPQVVALDSDDKCAI